MRTFFNKSLYYTTIRSITNPCFLIDLSFLSIQWLKIPLQQNQLWLKSCFCCRYLFFVFILLVTGGLFLLCRFKQRLLYHPNKNPMDSKKEKLVKQREKKNQ